MSTFLKLDNVSKSYGENQIFSNLTMEFDENKIYTIIGPSGSGKTTLMRCLSNLEEFDAGNVKINGEVVDYKKLKIGFVFQQYNLFNNLTVLENICLSPIVAQKRNEGEVVKKAEELLELVGILDKKNALPSQLSGGQKQRVAIARTLINKPDIIILDEPTSALDPLATKEVLNLIKDIMKNQSVFVITHEMDFARDVSDEVIFMKHGKVVERGVPEQLFGDTKSELTKEFIGIGE